MFINLKYMIFFLSFKEVSYIYQKNFTMIRNLIRKFSIFFHKKTSFKKFFDKFYNFFFIKFEIFFFKLIPNQLKVIKSFT